MGACSQFGIVVHCRTGGMNSVPHWAFTCLHLPQAAAGSALGAAKLPLRITHEGAAAPSYIPGFVFFDTLGVCLYAYAVLCIIL